MSERSEESDLTALESALRELQPKTETIPRDVLMYRAGRASVSPWPWRAATLCTTAAAFALSIALWIRPEAPIVYVAVPPSENEEISISPHSPPIAVDSERGGWSRYVQLQEQVFLYGLDGLPVPPSGTEEPPPSVESLLNSL